jgi:hypothetical protein
MVAASILMFVFAALLAFSSTYPIANKDLLLALTIANLPVGGVFGFLFASLSFFLASFGMATGILTLYGYRWARWMNIVLSSFLLYQSMMLLAGFLTAYQTYTSSWAMVENLAVIAILFSFNASRIYYMFTPAAKVFLQR